MSPANDYDEPGTLEGLRNHLLGRAATMRTSVHRDTDITKERIAKLTAWADLVAPPRPGDDVVMRLRNAAAMFPGTATWDLLNQAADALNYYEAQDGLLSKAQDQVKLLRDEIVEIKRPLDAEMARLNENLIKANQMMDRAVVESNACVEIVDKLRLELTAAKADSAMLKWMFDTSAGLMLCVDGFRCMYLLPDRSGKWGPVSDTKRGAVELAMKEYP